MAQVVASEAMQGEVLPDETLDKLPPAYAEGDAGFGALKSEKGLFPLRALKVHAHISGLVSTVSLEQEFENPHDAPLEATYIFPLASRAAVTKFQMEVNGRIVDGVVKEREEARQEYHQAIAQGHRAAIAEEERSGVFTVRVGNIGPHERPLIRLEMVQPLPYFDNEATFQFPLVVAPRYIPGTPLPGPNVGEGVAQDTDQTPDASRITPPVLLPGYPSPVQLAIEATIDPFNGRPASNVRCSLHTLQSHPPSALDTWHLSLHPRGDFRINRDFILRFRLVPESDTHEPAPAFALCPDSATSDSATSDGATSARGTSGEGTWQLLLVPPQGRGGQKVPQDVVFILDRSGSMGGWKMVAARSATAKMLDTLTPADRFAVFAFDNDIETPPSMNVRQLVGASDRNRAVAVEYLNRVDARGGTEMFQPLAQAADLLSLKFEARDRAIVLVTDGQAGNEDSILRSLEPKVRGQIRLFTLGIDQAVNEGFLRRLAGLTKGGGCELVESQARLEEAMDRVHRAVAPPVLVDVRVEAKGGLEILEGETTPARLPGLFKGAPLILAGRYRLANKDATDNLSVVVHGETPEGVTWQHEIPASWLSNKAVAPLWARGRIRELEDHFTLGQDREATRKRILHTSLQFQVLCRFTAFVAVDRSEKLQAADTAKDLIKQTQPVESPAGWSRFSGGLFGAAFQGSSVAAPCSTACAAPGATQPVLFGAAPQCVAFGAAPGGAQCVAFGAPSALARGERLERLVDTSQDLSPQASVFYRQAKKANSPVSLFGAAADAVSGVFGSFKKKTKVVVPERKADTAEDEEEADEEATIKQRVETCLRKVESMGADLQTVLADLEMIVKDLEEQLKEPELAKELKEAVTQAKKHSANGTSDQDVLTKLGEALRKLISKLENQMMGQPKAFDFANSGVMNQPLPKERARFWM